MSKALASTRNRFKTVATATVVTIIISVVFAHLQNSWEPIWTISLLFLGGAVFTASVAYTLAVYAGKKEWAEWTPVPIVLAVGTGCLLIFAVVSTAERMLWNAAVRGQLGVAAWMVDKNYGDRYTANHHRLFKFICQGKGKGPYWAWEHGETVYVRCGGWYPQVYSILATREAFDRADKQTQNDPPGQPIVIEHE